MWLHDRILLAQTGPATWIAASAHWDIYEEDASEWTILLRTGDRGGIGLGYSDRHRVRFKQSEIREELGRALEEAELEAAQLRAVGFVSYDDADVNGGGKTSHTGAPGPDGGAVWIAFEARGGVQVGAVVASDDSPVAHKGDRGVIEVNGAYVACARLGAWTLPAAGVDTEDDLRTLPVLYGPGPMPLDSVLWVVRSQSCPRRHSLIDQARGLGPSCGSSMHWLWQTLLRYGDIIGGGISWAWRLRMPVCLSMSFCRRCLSVRPASTSST